MPTNWGRLSRRQFIVSAGVGAVVIGSGLWSLRRHLPRGTRYSFSGGMKGANAKVGHLLRFGVKAKPTSTKKIDTVIVGGGIAGLSAAWWLQKKGVTDFVLLEMDTHVGGNSAQGENAVSKYPWGAHYVPLPGDDAKYVREFFEEIGVIKSYDKGLPVYDEYFLCADPHERLFFQGEWQDGLVPVRGVPSEDKRQYREFFSFVDTLKTKKGQDGKPLFNIPIDLSSRDKEILKWDQISMAEFMKSKGWTSKYLHWYVNYCCRDDYGMPHDKVSAWSGLHYFASRAGHAANADSQTVLTWPEGNGFLVEKMRAKVAERIQENSLAFNIETSAHDVSVDVLNTSDDSCTRYQAKHVIYCGPRFTAGKVIKNYQIPTALDYAPWMVANITLKHAPTSHGAQLSWDNVSYYSKSLGYIVANNQDLTFNRPEKVITYYLPLDEASPKEERMAAYRKSYEDWLDILIPDLEKMHPGVTKDIANVDVWIWGHGMVSPGIDYLWSSKRQEYLKPFGRVEFAHTDMSGISIFEEAQYRGVEAAKKVLAKRG